MFRVVEVVVDRGAEAFRGVADVRDSRERADRAAARLARRPGHASAVTAYAVVDPSGVEVNRVAVRGVECHTRPVGLRL